MYRLIRDRDGHFVFPIGTKNTNLEDVIEILLLVKFRWIPVSGFRGEVENVSANQRPERPSCFFSIGTKNTNLVEDIEILLTVKFRWISWSISEEKSKMSQPNQRLGGHLVLQIGRKTQFWKRTLRSYFLSSFVEFHSAVSEKSKMWKANDDGRQTTDNANNSALVHNSALGSGALKIIVLYQEI